MDVIAVQAYRFHVHVRTGKVNSFTGESHCMGCHFFRRLENCIGIFSRDECAVRVIAAVGKAFVGNAQSDAQCAAYGVRFHSDYDGSSGPCRAAFLQFVDPSVLPGNADGSKVEKSYVATATRTPRPPPLEVSMTSRMRELIQQLGEAIHESVIESEQIAGVVQDIRQHGFDVLLMLEATIGLNEVAAKEAEDAAAGAGQSGEETPFTPNDLHFLRSLRISVEGEEENAAETDKG